MTLRYWYYRTLNRWRRHRELKGRWDSIYGLNNDWRLEQCRKSRPWLVPLDENGAPTCPYQPGTTILELEVQKVEPKPDTCWFTNVVTRRGRVIHPLF